ncbi:conserved hypothetical protein [Verticillium alfalfae VaMs.102]|uniref:Uncharacterized protein n=1 Tax=Verticillium alfalfae (strain VaMs.102 / ATCC MYA-4576 / FGSC 10136) TaxID=526221 RepID=C9SBG9_VERA1|nr:conserved hypothetical protein [Verticillium alfalfae VaMs.102]EEY15703.1 conserved hypothetical protein [Verticillium alfalfae VaMs.102]
MASDLFGSGVLEVPSAVKLDSQARFGEQTRGHRQVPRNVRPVDSLTAHDPARLVRSSYSIRVNDAKDFASHWENEIVPMLASSLPTLLVGPFSVDVHTYPQLASINPPRLLTVTSSTRASSPAKEIITRMVVDSLPLQFRSVKLEFCQGTIELCANHVGTGPDDRDKPCQPRRAQYMSCPGPGASIGQTGDLNSASLGGFVNLGGRKSATTTRHQHDESLGSSSRPLCVQHPSPLDQLLYQEPFSKRNTLTTIGHVSHWSDSGSLRPSLVFSGISQHKELISIEMDWAVIDIQGPGGNIIPTPSFAQASEGHVVTEFAEVSGTTEVYGVGRTSGYSLAYTSDVPGLQYFNGGYHREWTVRQHTLSTEASHQLPKGGLETVSSDLADQIKSTEEWITGGVGVPGDSGAWLMTRDGDRVIGHVWARSTSYGPINNQRLTYFTPFVDLKADIEDKSQKHLSLPIVLSQAPARPIEPLTQMPSSWLFTQDSNDHWSSLSSPTLRSQRLQSHNLIKEITPTAIMSATSVVGPSGRASIHQLVQQNSFTQQCQPLGSMFPHECTTSDSRRSDVPSWSVGSSTTGETDTTLWRTQDSEIPDVVVPVFDERTLLQEQMTSQLRRAKAVPTGDELRLVRAIMALSQTAYMAQ